MLTAVLGMATVVWYAMGSHITEEDMESEVRERMAAQEARKGKFFGLFRISH